jgi:hypothetical protein
MGSWKTDDSFEIPQELVQAAFDRDSRLPFYERGQFVPISVRLHFSDLDWMDDIVAHREDPILSSRSAIMRDALDLYKHFWKDRQVFTSGRYFTEYELAKRLASKRRDQEFLEQLNTLLEEGRRGSIQDLDYVKDSAAARFHQTNDDRMKDELTAIISRANDYLSRLV